jgi:membrane-associated protease RseP (regulator of RpoE activity)
MGVVADDRNDRGRGVRLLEVKPEGPAAEAGLKQGDLLTGIGDLPVRQMTDLLMILDHVPAGNTVPVRVARDGQNLEIRVTLAERPASAGPRPPQLLPDTQPDRPVQPGPEVIPKAEPVPGVIVPGVPPNGVVPALPDPAAERIEEMERRIQELERRVAELEKALAESKTPLEEVKPPVPEPPGPKLEAPE